MSVKADFQELVTRLAVSDEPDNLSVNPSPLNRMVLTLEYQVKPEIAAEWEAHEENIARDRNARRLLPPLEMSWWQKFMRFIRRMEEIGGLGE